MISYLKGDATEPIDNGNNRILTHIVNNKGGFGAGFAKSLVYRWPSSRHVYKNWFEFDVPKRFEMGAILLHPLDERLELCHMLAQNGYKSTDNESPVDYGALNCCLIRLGRYARDAVASIHMPRIGTGLGGGKWDVIEPMLIRNLVDVGVAVYVYDI